MQMLQEKIMKEGQVLEGKILKVDSFLNHQMDPELMKSMGEEFAGKFGGLGITKVLTIESSGIGPAIMTALALGVPMIFARKKKPLTLNEGLYMSEVYSYTKKESNMIAVSQNHLLPGERVLIIDDFLANGQAALGLLDICRQAGASVSGIGIVIEKAFQDGGEMLRSRGIRVESLARIASLDDQTITLVEEEAVYE